MNKDNIIILGIVSQNISKILVDSANKLGLQSYSIMHAKNNINYLYLLIRSLQLHCRIEIRRVRLYELAVC